MNREFLKSLALEDDVIDQIMAEYGCELQQVQKDQESARKEAEEWQQKYQQREEELTLEQEKQAFESALHQKLTEAGARSVKAVGALLNRQQLSMEEGSITGLEEQISSIQQEHSYLFSSQQEAPPPKVVAPARGGGEDQRSLFSVIRAAAGL